MKAHGLITMLALAGFFNFPAWADHEGHQHGQGEATPAATAGKEVSGKAVPDDLKAGGQSCGKCKQGKAGSSGGGHDHGAAAADAGHRHGAAGAEAGIDALRERVEQLEKRLDLMQTLLEVMAERVRKGGHAGHH
jgi:hypothetical protein